MHLPSPTQTLGARWPYLLASILSGLLLIWSATWGYAEIITIEPRAHLHSWERGLKTPAPADFDRAWSQFETALTLNRHNAERYLDLARLALLKLTTEQPASSSYSQYRQVAIDNLNLAITHRPSWGLAWAYLAQFYASEPIQQAGLINALERAMELGPYEQINQRRIIPIAIAQWQRLPERQQTALKTMMQHALRYQPNIIESIITAAIKHRWLEELLPLVNKEGHKKRVIKAMQESSTAQ
ncbi:MAG: hypothetical protein FD130_74 [Halothiobacillaceae bacterium]|nr:MAG: hypothetical protein FD130_74 [Halothiobacillaceae bacterium]